MRTSTKAATWVWITWLWLASLGGTSGAADALPELSVYLLDCVGLGDDLLEAIRLEVVNIYSDTGVGIVWLGEPPEPARAHEARAYILDDLPPSLRRLVDISGGRAPLALTLGRGPRAPGADIYLSRKAVVGRASKSGARALKHLARAFGRTRAHELAHRYLRSGHTPKGILRATLTEHDLIDGDHSDLFFTDDQIRRLRATASRSTDVSVRQRRSGSRRCISSHGTYASTPSPFFPQHTRVSYGNAQQRGSWSFGATTTLFLVAQRTLIPDAFANSS